MHSVRNSTTTTLLKIVLAVLAVMDPVLFPKEESQCLLLVAAAIMEALTVASEEVVVLALCVNQRGCRGIAAIACAGSILAGCLDILEFLICPIFLHVEYHHCIFLQRIIQ